MIRSFYVKSQSITSSSNTTFWWVLQTQTEWVIFEPVRTHHLGLEAQNFEKPIFTFRCFSLKAVYNSCNLQRLLQVAIFLVMYFFTHINIVLLFRQLRTEIVIFINVCYQMKCFSGNSFSFFLGAGFANIPPFLISCEVLTSYSKTLKYSEQYIRDHLSDTKVRIWIRSEYDAVFNFSCIASCNLTKSFTFSFISFVSWESDSESFRQSTCTLYASEILLVKVFIMCVCWQVKWWLIGAFSLVFDIQWIYCQYL